MKELVERYFPRRGPCALCNSGIDARHRVLDAIHERYNAGDAARELADDYSIPASVVRVIGHMTSDERAE